MLIFKGLHNIFKNKTIAKIALELRKNLEKLYRNKINNIKNPDSIDGRKEKKRLESLVFSNISTKWINTEAMKLLTSFGKDSYLNKNTHDNIEVNKIHNPVLYQYYLKGNWDLY